MILSFQHYCRLTRWWDFSLLRTSKQSRVVDRLHREHPSPCRFHKGPHSITRIVGDSYNIVSRNQCKTMRNQLLLPITPKVREIRRCRREWKMDSSTTKRFVVCEGTLNKIWPVILGVPQTQRGKLSPFRWSLIYLSLGKTLTAKAKRCQGNFGLPQLSSGSFHQLRINPMTTDLLFR